MAQKGGPTRKRLLFSLYRDEEAADATEYGLMMAFMAVGIITTAHLYGTTLVGFFSAIVSRLPTFVPV